MLTMAMEAAVVIAIGPRPMCALCGRKHSARRAWCWTCYRKLRDLSAGQDRIETTGYRRLPHDLSGLKECLVAFAAVLAMLPAEDVAEVRDALAMKATG